MTNKQQKIKNQVKAHLENWINNHIKSCPKLKVLDAEWVIFNESAAWDLAYECKGVEEWEERFTDQIEKDYERAYKNHILADYGSKQNWLTEAYEEWLPTNPEEYDEELLEALKEEFR